MSKPPRLSIDGLLLVDKPQGPTSAAVLTALKHRFRFAKLGHAGTLDPLATGLLPVVLGEGTKLATHLGAERKRYLASAKLGEATDTQDLSGDPIFTGPVPADPEVIRQALLGFVGAYEQIPPMYSAKKVEGRPLYELARAGHELRREAISITVHAIEIHAIDGAEVRFTVEASKGFYVRTLCHDLGEKLGCGAHMTSLRRLSHGNLNLSDARPLDTLLSLSIEELTRCVLPLTHPAIGLPLARVRASEAQRVAYGHHVPKEAVIPDREGEEGPLFRALDPEGRLLALMRLDESGDNWLIERGFTRSS